MRISASGVPVRQQEMADLRSSTAACGRSSTAKVDREIVMIVRNTFFSDSGSVTMCGSLPKKLHLHQSKGELVGFLLLSLLIPVCWLWREIDAKLQLE